MKSVKNRVATAEISANATNTRILKRSPKTKSNPIEMTEPIRSLSQLMGRLNLRDRLGFIKLKHANTGRCCQRLLIARLKLTGGH
jgi:hypothetical protein